MGLKQMVAAKKVSCIVAAPSDCNTQLAEENIKHGATRRATLMQPVPTKALINKDSICNSPCNDDATKPQIDTQLLHSKTVFENSQLHDVLRPLNDGLVVGSVVVQTNTVNGDARYQHLVQCQQCEHLTITGHCRAKPQYKPMTDALRDCGQFVQVSSERSAITDTPYNQAELNDLLTRYAKKLLQHLIDCRDCCLEDSRYCVDGFAVGNSYEAMLLCFKDSPLRKDSLLTSVIKARGLPQ